ncbi:MAG: S8 family serine peptidase [Mycobacteriales bacterium]
MSKRIAVPTALSAVGITLTLIAGTSAPALAATPTSAVTTTASGPTQDVLLVLTPRSRAGLRALGTATGLTRAERLDRLAQVLPSLGERGYVINTARNLGLTVRSQTPMSVTVSAPASRVLALFGSARAVAPKATFGQALPKLPANLRYQVTAAFGGNETRPAARPLVTTMPPGGYRGPQLVQAYGGAAGANASGLQQQTIATIQLADWDDSAAVNHTTPLDLQTYANAAGITLAPGQYQSVVDTQDPPSPQPGNAATGPGGSDEVALDQEALLAVAPHARQRAYFSGNDPMGEMQDFLQVAVDASNGIPITALSTSWGACEPDTAPYDYAFDDVFSYILSTGVTIFAASGDNGVQDGCTDSSGNALTTPSVDFPASSPEVIAVGGTKLPSTSTDGNVSDGSPEPAAQTSWSGSGGGQSQLFTRPAWQLKYTNIGPGSNGLGRLVPDIASDADPNTGFEDFSSGTWNEVGGTSLAAPTQAALYTDELISHGIPNGLGDIHARLYSAPASDFTDITSGPSNSAGGVQGFAPKPGYDEITGLGTPRWDSLISAIDTDPGPIAAVTGINGSVFSHRLTQGGFTNLGGHAISVPSVVSYHGLTYYVVAGGNHEPYVRTDATNWHALTGSPANCYQPVAWIGAASTFFLACTDPANHQVYVAYTPLVDGQLPFVPRGASGQFASIGGQVTTGPAMIEYRGSLILDALAPGGAVWQNSIGNFNSTGRVVASGWVRTGFACASTPALAAYGADLYFACQGLDNNFWLVRHTVAGWGRAENLGGVLVGRPGISVDPADMVNAFVLGRGGVLYQRNVYPHIGPWVAVGGQAVGGSGAAELSG